MLNSMVGGARLNLLVSCKKLHFKKGSNLQLRLHTYISLKDTENDKIKLGLQNMH